MTPQSPRRLTRTELFNYRNHLARFHQYLLTCQEQLAKRGEVGAVLERTVKARESLNQLIELVDDEATVGRGKVNEREA